MRFIISFLCIFISIGVYSQSYNIDELIEVGLAKSLTIYREQITLSNTATDLKKSYTAFLPSLNWSASKRNHDGEWSNISSGLHLSESFSSNEPRYFALKKAHLQKYSGELTYEDVKKQVAFEIFSKYVSILQTQKTLTIQKKNMQLQESVQKQVKVQYDTGEKTLLDLQQSEISLLDYEISLIEAENSLANLRADLFAFLEKDDNGYEFSEISATIPISTFELKENLQMQTVQYALKSLEIGLFQQKLDFYPVFSLSFSYGLNNVYDSYGNLNSFSELNKYEDSYQIGLQVSYSFLSIFDKRMNYGRAKRDLKWQQISYEKTKREHKIQWERLQKDLATLHESQSLYEKKMKLAEANLNMGQEQYRLGLISLLDLDKITLDYSNTQLEYYRRYYNTIRKQEEINVLLSEKILGKW
jgi:outer membrane protein TolC